MYDGRSQFLAAAVLAALIGAAGIGVNDAVAQKIICWKDKSGKVVGCGDRVPPEYQESATKELDRRGVTRKTTESAEEAAKRRAQEQELANQKAEEQKKIAEQRRLDSALLATFSSENEIDRKRDRELQQVDLQVSQLQVSLKNAADRYKDLQTRGAAGQKDNKPSPALQEEINKTGAEKQRLEQAIAAREKDKEEIRKRYAEDKRRFLELKKGLAETTVASPAPATSKK